MNRKGRVFLGGLTLAMVAFAGACSDDDPSPTTPTTPATPTGVSATANGNDVTINWSGTGDSFIVQRQASGASFSQIASGVTGTSYTDSGVAEGSYGYRVIAVVGGQQSNASDPALVTVEGVDLRQALTGTISASRTLNPDSIYIIRGIVTMPGWVR